MEQTKRNHIETSSRASSAVNFNSVDIDLRSNLGSAFSNHRFIPNNPINKPFINVKSVNEYEKNGLSNDKVTESAKQDNFDRPSSGNSHIVKKRF